jgi:hypothetical protein
MQKKYDACHQALETEEALTTLSDEEVGAIRGGLKIKRSDVLVESSQENRLKI